jgi:hypothetical protein
MKWSSRALRADEPISCRVRHTSMVRRNAALGATLALALGVGFASCSGGGPQGVVTSPHRVLNAARHPAKAPVTSLPNTTLAPATSSTVPAAALFVPPTTAAPTSPSSVPPPSNCQSGSVSLTVASPSSSICLRVGTTLTVTFDSSASGPNGGWLGPADVYPSSIVDVASGSPSGMQLPATVKALAVGSATVRAYFSQQCSSGDSTPCTVPPQGVLQLSVTVVSY